ncbi:hypothetical protein ACFQHO_46975 [Actinomadura yumaensis]|uniref:hypothetical protein n=1 Tax=Actinomadura yumaensis TaxID=111807 RepID=UPI0036157CB5
MARVTGGGVWAEVEPSEEGRPVRLLREPFEVALQQTAQGFERVPVRARPLADLYLVTGRFHHAFEPVACGGCMRALRLQPVVGH